MQDWEGFLHVEFCQQGMRTQPKLLVLGIWYYKMLPKYLMKRDTATSSADANVHSRNFKFTKLLFKIL